MLRNKQYWGEYKELPAECPNFHTDDRQLLVLSVGNPIDSRRGVQNPTATGKFLSLGLLICTYDQNVLPFDPETTLQHLQGLYSVLDVKWTAYGPARRERKRHVVR